VNCLRARKPAFFLLSAILSFSILASAWSQDEASSKKPLRGDVNAGQHLFERHCALCHGIDGKGGRGPALNRVRLVHAPDDDSLRTLISEGIPPDMPEGYFLDEKDIANLAAFVRSLSKVPADAIPGDAARGSSVYARSGCSGCHVLNGAGTGYGPELTGIGDQHSASFLQKTVSKPASILPPTFLFVKVTTNAGKTLEGVRVNEDSFSIQIKDPTGRFHSFRKQDLKNLQKLRGETPMPPFEGILSASDLQDLVAYLASQRGKE
jgi:cytochrome c oxidase cbb3-type subunit 3